MKNTIKIILVGLILIIALFSCKQATHSIFWTIATDEPETNLSLSDSLTILNMFTYGADYYIGGGSTMWKRAVADTSGTWTSITFPANTNLMTALQIDGTDIYAGFANETISENSTTMTYSLYKAPIAGTIEWGTAIADTDIAGKQICTIFSANSILFFAVRDSLNNDFLYYLSGSDYVDTGLSDLSSPIKNICWDNTAYWAVTGSNVYTGTSPASLSLHTDLPADHGSFNSIYYSAAYGYFLSADNGYVYKSTDAATWTASAKIEVSSLTVYFTSFAETGDLLLVGTFGNGFFQMKNGVITDLKQSDKILKSALYNSSVTNFYTQGTTVFFLTAGDGLFNSTYDAVTDWHIPWTQE